MFWVPSPLGLEVLKYFSFVISSPNLSRNKLFKRPNLSKKGFSNNLYKGFTVVNKIYREIEYNKISELILSREGVIASSFCLLFPRSNCSGPIFSLFLILCTVLTPNDHQTHSSSNFLFLNQPKPSNIKPYSRNLQDHIKNPKFSSEFLKILPHINTIHIILKPNIRVAILKRCKSMWICHDLSGSSFHTL